MNEAVILAEPPVARKRGQADPQTAQKRRQRSRRSWWIRQVRSWHWVSAALTLVAILFFAVTGITLNHAGSIPATPVVSELHGQLPPSVRKALPATSAKDAPLPAAVANAVRAEVGLDAAGVPAEWSADEIYVALPRPGGDAWLSIDPATGAITAEITSRGAVSFLNDLHKGRNSGPYWSWFIDAVGIVCVVFTLSGLLLLQIHSSYRRHTWTVVAAGVAVPAVILIVVLH